MRERKKRRKGTGRFGLAVDCRRRKRKMENDWVGLKRDREKERFCIFVKKTKTGNSNLN